jgi:hypothetical protein
VSFCSHFLFKPNQLLFKICPGGGIGRHAGLKILWSVMAVRVQVPPRVQEAVSKGRPFYFWHKSIEPLRVPMLKVICR